jgi:hypothetical protein
MICAKVLLIDRRSDAVQSDLPNPLQLSVDCLTNRCSMNAQFTFSFNHNFVLHSTLLLNLAALGGFSRLFHMSSSKRDRDEIREKLLK